MIGPAAERPQAPSGPGFTDAVTFAFGDLGRGRHGFARVGVADGRTGSALAALFAGREPVATLAQAGQEVVPGWDSIEVARVAASVEAPLERWRVALHDGMHGFELEFSALGPPAMTGGGSGAHGAAVKRGAGGSDTAMTGEGGGAHGAATTDGTFGPPARTGVAGYAQLCRVTGTVTVAGRSGAVACLGQRGHEWGTTDWEELALTRTLAAWLPDGTALTLGAARPRDAAGHGEEARWGARLGPGAPAAIDDPRISTTADGDGRLRRAGLELWVRDDDEAPLRASGEVIAGVRLELGALRLDAAAMRWSVDGREGAGRYEALWRA